MAKRIVPDLPIADRLDATSEGKSIRYDRETGDYACFLDRQFLGYADSYPEAETKISAVYYEQLQHPITADAATTARCADITKENVDGMPAVAAAAFGDELAAAGLRIASVDEPGRAYALTGGIYAWVTEVVPFEPTEAELEAYAQEWDQAVADEQAALDAYAQEWDAAAQPAPLTITRERIDAGTPDAYTHIVYCVGDVRFLGDEADLRNRPSLYIGENTATDITIQQLRDLSTLLASAPLQALMGYTPPTIDVVPHICDDTRDVDFGTHIWTDYRAGTDPNGYDTEVTVPVTCTDPHDRLYAYVCGIDLPLDDLVCVLPQLIALVTSPVVQVAVERWREQVAERAARLRACPPIPAIFPEEVHETIRNAYANYGDDPQALAALLRRAAGRLAVA